MVIADKKFVKNAVKIEETDGIFTDDKERVYQYNLSKDEFTLQDGQIREV